MNRSWAVGLGGVLLVLVVLGPVLGVMLRGALQYRAVFPGGLLFIGMPEGIREIRYDRLHLLRGPDDSGPLPPLSLVLNGHSHPIALLTTATLYESGGSVPEGALYDTEGRLLQYRFSGERLTYLSVSNSFMPQPPPRNPNALRSNVLDAPISLVYQDGAPFTLPLSHSALLRHCGRPAAIRRSIPN